MIKTQYINLDMVPSGVLPVLYCSQYDIGRPLGLVVYNGGEAVDLDSYTVTIEATRSDGTAVLTAVTTDGNVGGFVTTATMTNQADKYLAKMVIVDSSENRVASLAFVMCITPKTMDENAESIEEDKSLYQQYTSAVQALIAEVKEDLDAESVARAAGDSNLSVAINDEAAARELADTEIGRRFNDLYYINLEQITTLAIPSGYGIQGGCYKGGYLYCIYHQKNSTPMLLGKFDLSTGALIDSFQVNPTGHGNAVSDFMDNLVLVCDSATNTIYFVDVVAKTVRHSVDFGSTTSLSSIAANSTGTKFVLQTPGQNAITGFYKLPYDKDGYDRVWYQEYLFKDILAKSTSLVQDMTFIKNIWLCCLNTNGYSNQEKKKNCIRVFCTTGVHARDIYFDNSIPEPEIITYDTSDERIIIVDRTGVVYKTVSVGYVFDSTYFGRLISTLNLEPSTILSAVTNVTETLTDSHGTHSIDMCFPICESGFPTGVLGNDATHRVRDRYTMQYLSDSSSICEGRFTQDGSYITFRAEGHRYTFVYRYTITDNAYARLTRFSGAYVDSNGVVQSLTTIGRRDLEDGTKEDDTSFMARLIASASAVYANPNITAPVLAQIRGDNRCRYTRASMALPSV